MPKGADDGPVQVAQWYSDNKDAAIISTLRRTGDDDADDQQHDEAEARDQRHPGSIASLHAFLLCSNASPRRTYGDCSTAGGSAHEYPSAPGRYREASWLPHLTLQ